MKWRVWMAAATAFGIFIGCEPAPDQGAAPPRDKGIQGMALRDSVGSTPTALPSGREADRAAFLNRIRSADPQFQTIQKAVLNEQNELGIILNRNVDLNSVGPLMRSLLTQMAKEFPNQDLTVIAYAPSDPPLKIGTGHLNARTRDMTYTPVRH